MAAFNVVNWLLLEALAVVDWVQRIGAILINLLDPDRILKVRLKLTALSTFKR